MKWHGKALRIIGSAYIFKNCKGKPQTACVYFGKRRNIHSKLIAQSRFSRTHNIGIIGIIANFVFPYICWLLHYVNHMMLVNMEIDVSEKKRITCWGYRFHWSSSFRMVELKRSWQYWHSCVAKNLWKPLFGNQFHISLWHLRQLICMEFCHLTLRQFIIFWQWLNQSQLNLKPMKC